MNQAELLRKRRLFKARGANAANPRRYSPDPRVKVGQRFGHLTVKLLNYMHVTMCYTACDCGREQPILIQELLDGKRLRCGWGCGLEGGGPPAEQEGGGPL